MSVRGNFVTAMCTELKSRLELEFQEGPVDGPQPDRDVGCVFFERKVPNGRDGNNEDNLYTIRVFRRLMQDQGGTEPKKTVASQLLDVCEELEAAFKATLTSIGHAYFTVLEVAPNYRTQGVEARIVAYDRNRSARGG